MNFTVDDQQIARTFQLKCDELHKALAKMTFRDLKDGEQIDYIEGELSGLKSLIQQMSNPAHELSKQMESSYDRVYHSYKSNFDRAQNPSEQPHLLLTVDNTPLDPQESVKYNLFLQDFSRYFPFFKTIDVENRIAYDEKIQILYQRLSQVNPQNNILVIDSKKKIEALEAKLNAASKKFARNKQAERQKEIERAAELKAQMTQTIAPPSVDPLSPHLERHIKFFSSDYSKWYKEFNDIDLIAFQDEKYQQSFKNKILRLKSRIAPIVEVNHVRVVEAKEKIVRLEALLQKAFDELGELKKKTEDVRIQLAYIKELFPQGRYSPYLTPPYTLDRVREWSEDISNQRDAILKSKAFLNRARKYSPEARTDEFQSYEYWFDQMVMLSLEQAIERMEQHYWNAKIWIAVGGLGYLDEDRLENPQTVEHILTQIKLGLESVESKLTFERIYYGQENERTLEDKAKILENQEDVLIKSIFALQNIRMPKAVSKDAELKKIALETIQQAGWLGKIERIVITKPKTPIDKLRFYSHDLHFYPHKGEEFQVSIAEKEGYAYWLSDITFKYIKEGAPNVPKNVWYISSYFRNTQILKESIDL